VSLLLNVVYAVLLIAFTPWLAYCAITKGKYRQGWSQKLFGMVPKRCSDAPCVWLHGVSVGEINVLATLMNELQSRFPEFDYVVSSTTKTGFDLANHKFQGHTVFYFPFDFSWAIRTAIRRLNPDVLILGELELWPNLIRIADSKSIDIAVVNARLSENSFRGYKRIKRLIGSVLGRIRLIAAQTDEYANRFLQLGANKDTVHVTGSTKFDGAETDRNNVKTLALARLGSFTKSDHVFLAGSTQAPEEQLAIQTFKNLMQRHPDLKLILVPRHPERFDEVARLLNESGFAWTRRSQLESPCEQDTRVLLVDTIGELGAWWGIAEIGFVGGSMGNRGGQNMIEPAAYGSAVCFGPKTKNFRDVVHMMLDADAAVVVHDGTDLTRFVDRNLSDSQYRQAIGQRAQTLVRQNAGALKKTIAMLSPILHRHITIQHSAPIRNPKTTRRKA
jgi:3-deoxy-D-manno-octulosonic-acid transferase